MDGVTGFSAPSKVDTLKSLATAFLSLIGALSSPEHLSKASEPKLGSFTFLSPTPPLWDLVTLLAFIIAYLIDGVAVLLLVRGSWTFGESAVGVSRATVLAFLISCTCGRESSECCGASPFGVSIG